MTGRKPLGPRLVEHLEGSEQAKLRLETILETIAGRLTIEQACERLSISEAMFHRLRMRVLQAGLSDLEPRPRGRPPQAESADAREQQRLAQEVEHLQQELQLAEVRQELATILPHLGRDRSPPGEPEEPSEAVKKTKRATRGRQRRRLEKRRHRRPR